MNKFEEMINEKQDDISILAKGGLYCNYTIVLACIIYGTIQLKNPKSNFWLYAIFMVVVCGLSFIVHRVVSLLERYAANNKLYKAMRMSNKLRAWTDEIEFYIGRERDSIKFIEQFEKWICEITEEGLWSEDLPDDFKKDINASMIILKELSTCYNRDIGEIIKKIDICRDKAISIQDRNVQDKCFDSINAINKIDLDIETLYLAVELLYSKIKAAISVKVSKYTVVNLIES